MPNLRYKACVRSDRGVQGGVPLICQISDIKACVRSDRGVQGGVSLICQISDIKLAFAHGVHQQIVTAALSGPGLPRLWGWSGWWGPCIPLRVSLLLVLAPGSFSIPCWPRASPGLF